MNILITGGNGYIASALKKGLQGEYRTITTVTRQDFDLTSYEQTQAYFKDKYFDVVIHTAVAGGSRLSTDSWDVFNKNVAMFFNLFSVEKQYSKLIHFGSGAEITAINTPYGYSKRVIRDWINGSSKLKSIRIYGVFDENELPTRFVKASIQRALAGEPIVVHQDRHMDFYYMKDLVALVDYIIANHPYTPEFICSYGGNERLSDIGAYISRLGGSKAPVKILEDRVGTPYNLPVPSYSPIKTVGLYKGIEEVYKILKEEHGS